MNIAATATKERYQLLRKMRESLTAKGYRFTDQRISGIDAFLRNEELKKQNARERREPKTDLSRERSEREYAGERKEH